MEEGEGEGDSDPRQGAATKERATKEWQRRRRERWKEEERGAVFFSFSIFDPQNISYKN